MDYKAEIVNALKASGFTVQNVNASFMFDSATTMQLPSGMELSFHAREDNNALPPHFTAIHEAFSRAKISFKASSYPFKKEYRGIDFDSLSITIWRNPPPE